MNNRLRAAAGVLLCCFALCSCGTVPDTIATVNGTKISGEEYERALNGFLANYGLTEDSLYESLGAEEAVEYKNNIIDEMVLQELMMQYAQEHGLDELNEDEKAEVTERAESYLENLKASFAEDVAAEGSLEGDAAQAEADRRFDDYVETYDYTTENLEQQFTRQIVLDRVYEDVMKDGVVTDADVRAFYDSEVERAAAEETETDAEEAVAQYVSGQDSPQVYVSQAVAAGVRNVKHVLIRIPQDMSEQISQLSADGQQEAAEQLRDEALALIRPEADEVLNRAQAGEDFDVLIAEYNDDPGMEYSPDGYEVYEGASYDPAFLADALSLENVGDVSKAPVESAFGYHIIQFASAPQAGPIPYEQIRDELESTLQQDKRRELWERTVAEWNQNAEVDKHEFRVKE